jgi:hypothetical protein
VNLRCNARANMTHQEYEHRKQRMEEQHLVGARSLAVQSGGSGKQPTVYRKVPSSS